MNIKTDKKMKKLLVKELKKLAKSSGYLTVKNFINDFDLSDIASISELEVDSKTWKLSIRKGHSFEHFTGSNFGW